MAVASAAPAQAQWRERDRDRGNGIDAGDVIAGALIIGGIAAVASAARRNRTAATTTATSTTARLRQPLQRSLRRPATAPAPAIRARRSSSASMPPSATPAAIPTAATAGDRHPQYRPQRVTANTVKGRIAVNSPGRNVPRRRRALWPRLECTIAGGQRIRGYDAGNFTCKVQLRPGGRPRLQRHPRPRVTGEVQTLKRARASQSGPAFLFRSEGLRRTNLGRAVRAPTHRATDQARCRGAASPRWPAPAPRRRR